MSEWYDIAPVNTFLDGTYRQVEVNGVDVAVFNLDGEFYAIQDLCTHDDGELAGGEVEGEEIVCPRHGARFSIKTGEVLAPPAYEAVDTYRVRIEDGMVQVSDEPR